jgi:hypothetical protein
MGDLSVKSFAEDRIRFKGHRLILAKHRTTFEVTKEQNLTPRGDCIIGVSSNKACKDLSEDVKKLIKRDGSKVHITIKVGSHEFNAKAFGSSKLTLEHSEDVVVRKSSFICPRTLAIKCDKAAIDIPREIVKLLREGKEGEMIIRVER